MKMFFLNIQKNQSSNNGSYLWLDSGSPGNKKFCNKNEIILIEDSSEAHGQIYNNQNCGSFGNISTFSFYANKHITMGEGGALLTDSSQLNKLLKE